MGDFKKYTLVSGKNGYGKSRLLYDKFLYVTKTGGETEFPRVAAFQQKYVVKGLSGNLKALLEVLTNFERQQEGLFRIDDMDLNLHYTLYEPVWRFFVEAEKGVSVMAVTQSCDNIAAFCKVMVERGEEAEYIRMDPEGYTRYSLRELEYGLREGWEVR